MATQRLTKYEKALNRALRLQAALLVAEEPTDLRWTRTDQAWQAVVDAHWDNHNDESCSWCDRYPPLFR